MPAHKKSAEILQLTGAASHDRNRYADRIANAVQDDSPLGDAPKQTLITFDEAWAEIVDMCPPGVLRKSDRLFVEQAARLHMLLRNCAAIDEIEGRALPRMEVKYVKQFESLMARLGASPADRGKVTASPPKEGPGDFD